MFIWLAVWVDDWCIFLTGLVFVQLAGLVDGWLGVGLAVLVGGCLAGLVNEWPSV